MKRLLLLSPLFLAACGAHFAPCVMPCPKGTPPHLCECHPYEASDGFSPAIVAPPVTPEPETPAEPELPKPPVDPKPEHPKPPHSVPKPEHPKHEPKPPKSEDC